MGDAEVKLLPQRWEYKCILIPPDVTVEAEASQLTKLGEKGWELVSVLNYNNGNVFYLKRPVNKLYGRHILD